MPLNPTRLLDTRNPNAIRFGALGAGDQVDLNVAGLAAGAGFPADATAAALKVTVTDSTASGFWTVYPSGTMRPTASNLNVIGAGTTIANQVLAQLSAGHTTVFSQSGGNLVIDLVGWFTGRQHTSKRCRVVRPGGARTIARQPRPAARRHAGPQPHR